VVEETRKFPPVVNNAIIGNQDKFYSIIKNPEFTFKNAEELTAYLKIIPGNFYQTKGSN